MPVPKGKEELYGKIAGHMQNLGKSLTEAKNIADKAVGVKPKHNDNMGCTQGSCSQYGAGRHGYK